MSKDFNTTDVTISPYSVTVDDELNKNYKTILFVEGRAIQGQELNNMVAYFNRKLTEVLAKQGINDGSILGGSLPIVDGTTITIPDDIYVWAKGEVCHRDATTTLTITGEGNETIGCKIIRTIIEETDDAELLDPATAWQSPEGTVEPQNAGQPGAHRIKFEVVYTTTGFEYGLWHFKNGVLQNAVETPQGIVTLEMFERRERLSLGDYTAKPVRVYILPSDNDKSYATICANRYFVDGKEITRIQDERIQIPHAKEYDTVNNEPQLKAADQLEYDTNEFPIRDMSDMSMTIEATVLVNRSNTQLFDTVCTGTSTGLPPAKGSAQTYGSLFEVLEVYSMSGQTKIDYTIGSDPDDDCYKDGNNINWSHSGGSTKEPPGGTDYYVKCKIGITGVLAVRAAQTVTDEAVTINSTNTPVSLAHNDVCGTIVKKGETTYIEGTDYTIQIDLEAYENPSTLDPRLEWTPTSNATITWIGAVAPGNVTVSYTWWKHTKEGHYVARNSFSDPYNDSINTEALVTGKNTGFRNYISFNTATTEKPIDASTFTFDYNVYRPRRDLIEICRNEQFILTQGVSEEEPKFPEGHQTMLTIAKLYLPPDSPRIKVFAENCAALKQPEIHEIEARVTKLQDLIAKQVVEDDADISITRIDAEKGRTVENFVDLRPNKTALDFFFNKNSVAFGARVDIYDRYATLPFSETETYEITPNIGESTARIGNKYYTLQGTQASVTTAPLSLKQLLATRERNINPYGNFSLAGPFIKIDPQTDTWVNETIITREEASRNVIWERAEVLLNTNFFNRLFPPTALPLTPITDIAVSQNTTFNDSTTFLRTKTINIEGLCYTPLADNIFVNFDGVLVHLTPKPGTLAGTNPGTVKAKADGTWEASFTIPMDIPTGIKEVTGTETNENETRVGKATYVAAVERRITERTTIRRETIVLPIIQPPVPPPDPLGQIIVPDRQYDIKSVSFYFTAKDSSGHAVSYIRNVRDGVPTYDTIGGQDIKPSDVSISANGSTISTFTYEDVVQFEAGRAYLLAIGSDSPNYKIAVAKGGENDLIDTTRSVTSQAYTAGDMMSSSSGLSWLVHPDEDLKFCLHPMVYNSVGTLEFDNIVGDLTSFIMSANQDIRRDTRVIWEYSVNNGNTWKVFIPNEVVNLSAKENQLKLRATLESSDPYASPIIDKNITLIRRVNNTSGTVISRNINCTVGREYYKAHVCAEFSEPSGTEITGYFSTDNGLTWEPLEGTLAQQEYGEQTDHLIVDSNYTRYWWVLPFWVDKPVFAAEDFTALTTGGSLADGTYYYKISYINDEGETLPCVERSVTITGSSGAGSVEIDFGDIEDMPAQATGYKVYRSNSTNTETLKYILTGEDIPDGVWTDDGSDPDSSSDAPNAVPTAREYHNNARIRFDLISLSNPASEPRLKSFFFTLE